ncbi:MAG TPA: ATP-binding protein, partial [Candidatus Eisenbacteria bacterium]|nr:ATP-binding protein [Candidatus Eisenbacteria bacterium]
GPGPHPELLGLASTAAADQAIAGLQRTALALGALGLLLAFLLGGLWSSQISRPVERLAAFSHRLAQGEWDEPLALSSVRELETLVAALDRMRTDLKAYRDRLVTSERQAAWSQMARRLAHEVQNPLTPIAVSLADLQRSYDLHRPDFPEILARAVRTIGEEVESLRHLLREFSEFARLPAPRLAPCGVAALLADLAALYAGEVAAGRLAVPLPGRNVTLAADAGQLRQALVNLIQNALEAAGPAGHVRVSADVAGGALEIAVADDGPGLDAEQRAQLFVPGFTTKPRGSGLGLTIVQRIANDHGGSVTLDPGGPGATFRLRLPLPPEG